MAFAETNKPSFRHASSSSSLLNPGKDTATVEACESTTIRKCSRTQGVSKYSLWAFALSSIAILIAVAFVTFLWQGRDAQSSWNSAKLAQSWRKILTTGWLTRAITLSSLAIRVSVVVQAGIAVSLLAGFVLEHKSIPVHRVAELSIFRSINTGPYDLFQILARDPCKSSTVFVLSLVLTVTTTLSQLTSTALLTDLTNGVILGEDSQSPLGFALKINSSKSDLHMDVDYWRSRPYSYIQYAEYSRSPLMSDDFVDTGDTIRAFLPFLKSEDRTKIHSYSGMAPVMNLRTVCTKPTINASVEFSSLGPILIGYFQGKLPFNMTATEPDLASAHVGDLSGFFSCSIGTLDENRVEAAEGRTSRARKEWAITMCRIYNTTLGTVPDGGAFLILNTTRANVHDPYTGNDTLRITSSSNKRSPWLDLTTENSTLMLSTSICFTISTPVHAYVHMHGNGTGREPIITWDPLRKDYDTLDVREQLGVSSNTQISPEQRGILQLDSNYTTSTLGHVQAFDNYRDIVEYRLFTRNVTAVLCRYCSAGQSEEYKNLYVHRLLTAVFQDILVSTNNPALALQALYHTLFQMLYSDILPEADLTTNATYTMSTNVLMPTHWRGYAICVIVLAVHFVVMGLSFALFLTYTRLSQLGNTWQVIAQVAAGETQDVVAASTTMTDKVVKRRIRRAGSAKGRSHCDVRLTALSDGRVGFVGVDRVPD